MLNSPANESLISTNTLKALPSDYGSSELRCVHSSTKKSSGPTQSMPALGHHSATG